MRTEVGAATHVGQVRELNEDSVLARPDLAVIADGMGGHAAGDVASALAVQEFASLSGPLTHEVVVRTLDLANAAILSAAATHDDQTGMGTTIVGIAEIEQAGTAHWLLFNIGDSRAYRIREDSLVQLTVDHSAVAEMVAEGSITEEEARVHPLRSVVTRSLGSDPAPLADVWTFPPDSGGDRFLLCSDGLTNEIDPRQVVEIARAAGGPQAVAEALVIAAVGAGGRDNVTAVVIERLPDGDHGLVVDTVPRREAR